MIKGCALLDDKLKELGIKAKVDEKKAEGGTKESFALEVDKSDRGERKRSTTQGRSFVEVTKAEKCQNPSMI